MIEVYFLIALLGNIVADLLIWKEVRVMRISHQTIMIDTQCMKIVMEQTQMGFKEFSESLGPALTDHAKMTAKAVTGAIGYYQGKAKETSSAEIESLQGSLAALGPLAELISNGPSSPSNNGDGQKYHV